MEVETWQDPMSDALHVRVTLGGETHERTLSPFVETDWQDLKIAGSYWEFGDRAGRKGFKEAMLSEHCMAIERLFPHLREKLPA